MPEALLEGIIYVPVRESWYAEVLKLIARLADGDHVNSGATPEPTETPPEQDGGLDPELIRRMYKESQEPHQRLMRYLADRPDEWVYSKDLAEGLSLRRGAASLAGMLGAFGRRATHRYGGEKPWVSEWDPGRYEAKHKMVPEVAAVVKNIATP